MAKPENRDFYEEILKNQLKVRKHTPQNGTILFNLSVRWAYWDPFIPHVIQNITTFNSFYHMFSNKFSLYPANLTKNNNKITTDSPFITKSVSCN